MDINSSLAEIEAWLLASTGAIDQAYFHVPVAGQADREYRERVYCYELYHQWRHRWRTGCEYSLGGELDKAGHQLIRDWSKPDFLVHRPGLMDNLLIVEVKTASATATAIWADMLKLCRYRGQPINYRQAILLIYGLSESEWQSLRQKIKEEAAGSNEFDSGLFRILLHESPGRNAHYVDW